MVEEDKLLIASSSRKREREEGEGTVGVQHEVEPVVSQFRIDAVD